MKMKWRQIQTKGKELELNTTGMKKAELIRSIQKAEGNFDCFGTAEDYCDQWECCFRSLCLKNKRERKIMVAENF